MQDFALDTGRSAAVGFRTKKARRRAELRQARHMRHLKSAQAQKRKAAKARKKRVAEGWWTPRGDSGAARQQSA